MRRLFLVSVLNEEYGGQVRFSEDNIGCLVFRKGGAIMKSIDKDIVIPADGTLPRDIREAFCRKARVVVYLKEDETQGTQTHKRQMCLAGKIRAFGEIDDPIGVQRDFRNSWEPGWDQ